MSKNPVDVLTGMLEEQGVPYDKKSTDVMRAYCEEQVDEVMTMHTQLIVTHPNTMKTAKLFTFRTLGVSLHQASRALNQLLIVCQSEAIKDFNRALYMGMSLWRKCLHTWEHSKWI